MKQLSMIILALCLAGGAFAQNTWSIDKGHSKIGFTVGHHMISEVDGYFRTFTARMTATKDDFSDAAPRNPPSALRLPARSTAKISTSDPICLRRW